MSVVGDVGFRIGGQIATLGNEVGQMSLEAQGAWSRAQGALAKAEPGSGVFISLHRQPRSQTIIGFDVHEASAGVNELTKSFGGKLEGDTIALIVKGDGGVGGPMKQGWAGVFHDRPDMLQGVRDRDLREYAGRNPILREWLDAPQY